MRAACLLLAVALQCGCSREPDFAERYDAASKQIGTSAREMDEELDKRAAEAAKKDEAGSPPRNGPESTR